MPIRIPLARKTILLPFVDEESNDVLFTKDGRVRLVGVYELDTGYSFTAAGIGSMLPVGSSVAAGAFTATGTSFLAAFSAGDLAGAFTAAGTSSLSADISGAVSASFSATGTSTMISEGRVASGLSERTGMLGEAASLFDDGSTYPSGAGYSITGGDLVFDTPTTANVLSDDLAVDFVTGRTYAGYMYMTDRVAGSARFRAGTLNSTQGNAFSAARRYIETFVAGDDHTEFGVRGQVFEGTVAEVQAYDMQDQIDGPIDIYICAGQSNMVGASGETGFDLAIEEPEFRALGISGTENIAYGYATDGSGPTINANLSASEGVGTIRPLVNPVTHSSTNFLGVSPVVSMATAMCNAGTDGDPTPLFACVAAGGTDLFTEWDAAGDARNYDLMVANVNAALALNVANRVVGLFWCQGESSIATGYAAQFKTMIDALRVTWGEFPVVILEHGGIRGDTGFDNMRAEHLKSVTGSGDASELTNCVYVDRPGSAALESDNIHYTGTTNRQRGIDAAQAMLALDVGYERSFTSSGVATMSATISGSVSASFSAAGTSSVSGFVEGTGGIGVMIIGSTFTIAA